MSDQTKRLLIDIGNSRIKYAFASDLNNIYVSDTVSSLQPVIEQAFELWVACVGAEEQLNTLQTLATQNDCTFNRVRTQPKAFGLTFAYEDIRTLGVDRWLAMIAARHLYVGPLAVLSLGTANTCDVLCQDSHLGGWIAPGFSLMRSSLMRNTAQVFADEQFPTKLTLGDKTQDCVAMGCLASQQGFVLMANDYMSCNFDQHNLLVSGGAQQLVKYLSIKNVNYSENLVLVGLDIVSKNTKSDD